MNELSCDNAERMAAVAVRGLHGNGRGALLMLRTGEDRGDDAEGIHGEDNDLRTAHGTNVADMRQRARASVSKSRTKGLLDEEIRLSFWS